MSWCAWVGLLSINMDIDDLDPSNPNIDGDFKALFQVKQVSPFPTRITAGYKYNARSNK